MQDNIPAGITNIKAGTVTQSTDGSGNVSVNFAAAFGSTPVVITQLENDVDYYSVLTAKNANGFTVKILKTAHVHSQGNTGSESSHTHGISFTSGAGSAHAHSNPSTSSTGAHTHTNPGTSAVSAGTPAGSIGNESSHTHTQGVTGGPSATVDKIFRSGITDPLSLYASETSGGSPTKHFISIQSVGYPTVATDTHTHTNPTTNTGSAHNHSFSGSALGTHSHTQGSTNSAGDHSHTQGNTGSESAHTHTVSGTSAAGSSHAHSNPDVNSSNAGNALVSTSVKFSYIAMLP